VKSKNLAKPTFGDRTAGILIHPTSLASPYGAGDIGQSARHFLEDLKQSGCRWWQMLPVHPVGEGFSPYSSPSAFAGETLLVSLEDLAKSGLVTKSELAKAKVPASSKVPFAKIQRMRTQLVNLAAHRATKRGDHLKPAFKQFVRRESPWLVDYVLF